MRLSKVPATVTWPGGMTVGPKLTLVWPTTKFVPVMVTWVPPTRGPEGLPSGALLMAIEVGIAKYWK